MAYAHGPIAKWMRSRGKSAPKMMRMLASSGRSLAWAVPVMAEAAALGRSIALAWTIGPDELGRAMMLALTIRMVEMATDMGIERLIVQAPDGNSTRLQSELHAAAVLRGVICAAILLALAPVLAAVFADGPNAVSYASLAVIPLFRGFVHLDYRRAERQFRYIKMSVVEGGATIAMAASVVPTLGIFPDHRAMAIVLAVHAVSHTVLSHAVADRRYAVKLSNATLRRSRTFGAPLVMNAGLLFLTFYADRFIVAQVYGWASLALYGVVLQLALLPAQIVGRAAASLVLPELRLALASNEIAHVWSRCLNVHLVLAGIMVAGFTTLAPTVIAVVYGAAFKPDFALVAALAFAAGFRILRTPFSQLAVATGRTGDPARANLIRALALVPAAACAAAGLPLAAVAATAALGEAGATLRAVQLSSAALTSQKQKDAFA